jgi:GTP-binding protein EngB required for normal cell division
VLTKSDKLSSNQMTKSKATIAEELEVQPASMISSSVVTKKGIDEVRREIASRL